MKSFINLAICGMLAFAVNAHAASVQLAANAVEAIEGSATAQKWVSQKLGVKAGATVAELNEAIRARKNPAEQAAVINAINAFAGQSVKGTDIVTKAKNENLARAAFTSSNNQLLEVAAMVTKASGRENITNAASCPSSEVIANQLYNDVHAVAADITLDDVVADVKGGYLNIESSCGHVFTDMKSKDAEANEIRITTAERNCLSGQSPNHHPKLESCLIEANASVFKMTADQAKENADALKACNYNNQTSFLN